MPIYPIVKQVLCKKGRGAIRVLQAKMFAEAEKVCVKRFNEVSEVCLHFVCSRYSR